MKGIDKARIFIDKDGDLVVEIIRNGLSLRAYKVDELKIENNYWRNTLLEVKE